MTPLTAFISRFLEGELEKSITGPVLVVEPRPPAEEATQTERQFRTASGTGTPTSGEGESYVLEIKKQKNNAFQRGVTLGRTRNNDLVIADGSVSRFHAWFQHDKDSRQWSVADAGSKNGTQVGKNRLVPKKPVPLKGGERLRFGKVHASFLFPRDFTVFMKARLSS